jgi:hypothetical protein
MPFTVDLIVKKSQNDKVVEEDGLEKLATLEERIRAIEGNNMYDPVKVVEMRLVPNVIILKMFKVLKFQIY